MERLSSCLIEGVRPYIDSAAIVWGGTQLALPLFMGFAALKAVWLLRFGDYDLLHTGDPVMAPLGWLLGKLTGIPVVVTVHGKDVTFASSLYQRVIPGWILPRLAKIICISHSTMRACVQRGISPTICEVVLPGVDASRTHTGREEARSWLWRRLGIVPNGSEIVLLTVGRLVPRKGVTWFVEQVVPRLDAGVPVHYVVIGDGPDGARLRALADQVDGSSTIHVLGGVSQVDKQRAFAAADLFIMPNVRVPGDMEGFGLVATESTAYGLPVLASDLEGIRDAVLDGQTGRLLPPEHADAWVFELRRLFRSPSELGELRLSTAKAAAEAWSWDAMARRYVEVFAEVIADWAGARA
ncbi:MAG: glycosyltransferase family 4 protein [Anaerolineae bacterium]|nr:glycosyltransferase family 4 protein [Anaerolineae bacterium]